MSTSLPTIKLDNFEGPYDLLLELAHRRAIDLRRISLSHLTDQFLYYLQQHHLSPTTQADFLVVAATLLLLKLKQVMPSLSADEEDELATLSDRLRRYQLYRDEALALQASWGGATLRSRSPVLVPTTEARVTIEPGKLVEALEELVAHIRIPQPVTRHLRRRGRTVQQCIELVQQRLARLKETTFTTLVPTRDRDTVALSLLALLELVRQRQVQVDQDQAFGTITISQRTHDGASPKT